MSLIHITQQNCLITAHDSAKLTYYCSWLSKIDLLLLMSQQNWLITAHDSAKMTYYCSWVSKLDILLLMSWQNWLLISKIYLNDFITINFLVWTRSAHWWTFRSVPIWRSCTLERMTYRASQKLTTLKSKCKYMVIDLIAFFQP